MGGATGGCRRGAFYRTATPRGLLPAAKGEPNCRPLTFPLASRMYPVTLALPELATRTRVPAGCTATAAGLLPAAKGEPGCGPLTFPLASRMYPVTLALPKLAT